MNIHLDNVNLSSTSGPNSFASKLYKYALKQGHSFDTALEPDVYLAFIETYRAKQGLDKPLFTRLDGIYFNTDSDYNLQNTNIRRTYELADGVIFQSDFNKDLVTKYFGEHQNNVVIHNGADLEAIANAEPLKNPVIDKFENVWCCAASWRPHKRLQDNINYFLEHKGDNDCLIIAGKPDKVIKDTNLFYVGDIKPHTLLSLYKRSKFFIHLAWLDHCPNVVVDASASGCHIVCSSSGGTREIAGLNSTIVEEAEWDFRPTRLYNPPKMDVTKKFNNTKEICYDMEIVTKKYIKFMTNVGV